MSLNNVPTRSDFRFTHRLRVRWVEVDMQRIVFNGHYLMYLDTAVADYWRALAMPYTQAMVELGGDLYVKKASLTYHASAEFDDLLDVCLRCAKVGNTSMVFEGAIFLGAKCLITAELIYVFADPSTQTSKPVPQALRDWLNAFEARQTMTSCALEPWSACATEVVALRQAVFHDEMAVPVAMLSDEHDAPGTHAVVRNRLNQVVASGRLIEKNDAHYIGRMATLRPLRGGKLGVDVMHALEAHAQAAGVESIALSAMCSAENFYKRLGYSAFNASYELVGIAHVDMQKALKPKLHD